MKMLRTLLAAPALLAPTLACASGPLPIPPGPDFKARAQAAANATAITTNATNIAATTAKLTPLQSDAKLLRAAEAAAQANPWSSPPWHAPIAWTANEVLPLAGMVRSAGGVSYTNQTAGTTGTTAPNNTVGFFNDNGIFWTPVGPVESTADDASAPTCVSSTTATSGYTHTYNTSGTGNGVLLGAFRIANGYQASPTTTALVSNFTRAPGLVNSKSTVIDFNTDVDGFMLRMNFRYSMVQLIIDGRRYAEDGIAGAGTGSYFIQCSLKNGNRNHSVRVQFKNFNGQLLTGIIMKPTAQIWAPTRQHVTCGFIGDSHWDGSNYGPFISGGSEPERIADMIGCDTIIDASIGGTGELNPGTASVSTGSITGTDLNITAFASGSPYGVGQEIVGTNVAAGTHITAFGTGTGGVGHYTVDISQTAASGTINGVVYRYGQRVPELMARKPDWGFVFGSGNDSTYTTAAIQAQASATMAAMHAVNPNMPLVRFGVTFTNPSFTPIEAAIQAAAQAQPDYGKRTFFVGESVDNVTGIPWVTRNGTNNGADTSGSNEPLVGGINTDGTHSPEAGTAYRARRAVQAIRAQVLPVLAGTAQ